MVYFMLEKTNIRIMFVIKNNTIMGYVRQNIFTNTNNYFFTIELKVTKSNRVNISPHQIAFHKSRKKSPSFFLVKSLDHGQSKKSQIYLVPSSLVDLLINDGLVAFSPLVDWNDLVTKLDQLVA